MITTKKLVPGLELIRYHEENDIWLGVTASSPYGPCFGGISFRGLAKVQGRDAFMAWAKSILDEPSSDVVIDPYQPIICSY